MALEAVSYGLDVRKSTMVNHRAREIALTRGIDLEHHRSRPPSAFAKRYMTAEVLVWCDQAAELVLSVIAIPELISAFCRLEREGKLSATQYRRLKSDLMADIADVLICDTTPQVIQHSVQALEGHPLRGMDAIHLGAAVVSSE